MVPNERLHGAFEQHQSGLEPTGLCSILLEVRWLEVQWINNSKDVASSLLNSDHEDENG